MSIFEMFLRRKRDLLWDIMQKQVMVYNLEIVRNSTLPCKAVASCPVAVPCEA